MFEEWLGGALPKSRDLRIAHLKFFSTLFWLSEQVEWPYRLNLVERNPI